MDNEQKNKVNSDEDKIVKFEMEALKILIEAGKFSEEMDVADIDKSAESRQSQENLQSKEADIFRKESERTPLCHTIKKWKLFEGKAHAKF